MACTRKNLAGQVLGEKNQEPGGEAEIREKPNQAQFARTWLAACCQVFLNIAWLLTPVYSFTGWNTRGLWPARHKLVPVKKNTSCFGVKEDFFLGLVLPPRTPYDTHLTRENRRLREKEVIRQAWIWASFFFLFCTA